jgi:hypothetical protein
MDEKYTSMTDAEVGFYHRCLNVAWLNVGLPSDLDSLARLMHVTRKYLDRQWIAVGKCWHQDGDRLYNRTQEEERTHATTKSERATESVRTRYGRRTNDLLRAYDSDSVSDSSSLSSKEKKEENPEYTLPFEDSHAETPPDHPRMVRPAAQAATSEDAGWFAQWWATYWRRGDSKKAAQQAFVKHVKTEARFQQVMAATRAQEAYMMSKERNFRPLGATWLNGERWEDEPSAPVNGTHPPGARPSSTDAVRALAMRNLERTGHLL